MNKQLKLIQKKIKKNNLKLNLAEWCIILFLIDYPNSKRKEIAVTLQINGARIGYIIKNLKEKGLIKAERDKNHLVDVNYSLNYY